MTKYVATIWLLGFITNMALVADGSTTTSRKILASALWPIGLIVYLDRGAPSPTSPVGELSAGIR